MSILRGFFFFKNLASFSYYFFDSYCFSPNVGSPSDLAPSLIYTPIEVGVVNDSDSELTERVLPSNYLFF